jgi:hypothetical protein
MFKFARNRAQKIAGNNLLLLLRLSFLIACGLWFWGFYGPKDDFGDIVIEAIVAIIFGAITFEWVALGLAILFIPFRVLYNIIRGR